MEGEGKMVMILSCYDRHCDNRRNKCFNIEPLVFKAYLLPRI